jgi:hypothetical protein
MDEKHKRSRIEAFINEPKNLIEALLFFKQNSGQIDVLMNGSIE